MNVCFRPLLASKFLSMFMSVEKNKESVYHHYRWYSPGGISIISLHCGESSGFAVSCFLSKHVLTPSEAQLLQKLKTP